MIDKELVIKVARLAKLEIPEDQLDQFEVHFSKILQDFESLQVVDTEGVEPMITPLDGGATLRNDVVAQELDVEELLSNAPDRKGTLFKVPPVVS